MRAPRLDPWDQQEERYGQADEEKWAGDEAWNLLTGSRSEPTPAGTVDPSTSTHAQAERIAAHTRVTALTTSGILLFMLSTSRVELEAQQKRMRASSRTETFRLYVMLVPSCRHG